MSLQQIAITAFLLGLAVAAWIALTIWSLRRSRVRPKAAAPARLIDDLSLVDDLPAWLSLTPRQREVAVLAADGLSNREIAEKLSIEVGTVETHLRQIYVTLGIHRRTQLANLLRDRRWSPHE